VAAKSQILILSSIDWNSAWQRHHIFAAQFAAAGHEVFFVENSGFRNPGVRDLPRVAARLGRLVSKAKPESAAAIPAGLKVIAPKVLPPTWSAFRRANRLHFVPQLLETLKAEGLGPEPVVLCYFATETTLEIIRRLSPKAVIYDCASNFRDHPDAPKDFRALEEELLDFSELVVCDSDYLFEQKRAEHSRVVQIHQGVDPIFLKNEPRLGPYRSFCYYGTWTAGNDGELLAALAASGFEVTFSGFLKHKSLPAGVRHLPPVRREELPARLAGFDAFLMPYKINPFHMGVVPAKIYECLAFGRPVLATPLPSLKKYSQHIYIQPTAADWARTAKNLPSTESLDKVEARQDLAAAHTYAAEFARLTGEIDKVIAGK
jgi:glycosyltransferase involved in cell wall biosynthesis